VHHGRGCSGARAGWVFEAEAGGAVFGPFPSLLTSPSPYRSTVWNFLELFRMFASFGDNTRTVWKCRCAEVGDFSCSSQLTSSKISSFTSYGRTTPAISERFLSTSNGQRGHPVVDGWWCRQQSTGRRIPAAPPVVAVQPHSWVQKQRN
jgi:hypothetical protein